MKISMKECYNILKDRFENSTYGDKEEAETLVEVAEEFTRLVKEYSNSLTNEED